MRLITVDVGNTATSIGVFDLHSKKGISSPRSVRIYSTSVWHSQKSGVQALKTIRRSGRIPPHETAIIVSSVVPSVDSGLKKAIKRVFRATPHFVSSRDPSLIRVKTLNPGEVGADRLANARGAAALTGRPCIIVDFGTATTFDCVTRRREYLGGVITPGPAIAAEALYQRTAKLPRVYLDKPVRILGRNTQESIRAGLYHGYRGLVREIVLQLKKRMGSGTTVLATGGQAGWVLRGIDSITRIVPHLTHLGLAHFWLDLRGRTRS